MSNEERFIYKNEEDKLFSKNVYEKDFLNLLIDNTFILFTEKGLVKKCSKCSHLQEEFLELEIPDPKEEKFKLSSAVMRMNSYLELAIQNEIKKELDLSKSSIEKKVREKYKKLS